MKELRNTNFYAVILILVMLTGIFSLSPATSLLLSDVTLRSSGTIVSISPLHVEGRYIKNAFGNIVYLRGLQKVEFADDPDGIWIGDTYWKTENVIAELNAMKSWGANVVRVIQAVEHWKYDMSEPYAAIPNRQAIKEFLTLAGERGMYVIFTPYRVTDYWHGGLQDPLPYPPYQTSEGALGVIANEQEFVDYWADVATELKSYPNVIFELWNEPHTPDGYDYGTVEANWFSVAQDCIDAIRATGVQQLIIFQWNMGVWANLDHSGSVGVEWIEDYPLVDSTGNLVYGTHIYREYGGHGFYNTAESKQLWDSDHAWDYDELIRCFQKEKIDWVGDTLNKTLFITETGCNIANIGAELQHELDAWNNSLTIFNEWGLHYVAHWWRNIGIFRLLESSQPWIPPSTESGLILMDALASA